eukprot:scaffold31559_cov32-Tisochrysis_lutea.AAC.4
MARNSVTPAEGSPGFEDGGSAMASTRTCAGGPWKGLGTVASRKAGACPRLPPGWRERAARRAHPFDTEIMHAQDTECAF